MMECSNETIKQQMIIAEKELVGLKREFGRAIVDVQKKASMNRFVSQMKKKAAEREANFYEALGDNVSKEEEDRTDYYLEIIETLDGEIKDVKQEIVEYATEHKSTEENYMDAFVKNEINLADVGFPIKKTGAKTRGAEEDVLGEEKMSRRHNSISLSGGRRKSMKHMSVATLSVRSGPPSVRSLSMSNQNSPHRGK